MIAQGAAWTIPRMDIEQPTDLLGGLSPQTFMRRHWQKKPLLIRQALPAADLRVDRAGLLALAGEPGVESRLIERRATDWKLRHGPFTRRQIPPLSRPDWTLLVQGVDLHVPQVHELLSRFRFAPDVRLDDVMVSLATDGGGVGPHFDSYDVFLLQLAGRRRWQVGRMKQATLKPGLPLKILEHFDPECEWTLEPGDMLYLPPRWAHDGVAQGECITASIGFRAPSRDEIGAGVLQRMLDGAADDADDAVPSPLYRDPAQPATDQPARIPPAMTAFAADAVHRIVASPRALDCALGEWLSEPKPQVLFDAGQALPPRYGVVLDAGSRMLYDDHHVFINGASFLASGRDASLMRTLADARCLPAAAVAKLSVGARDLLQSWAEQGWLHAAASEA
jgi:50S ribosomal protein L16 3-hydroxylase